MSEKAWERYPALAELARLGVEEASKALAEIDALSEALSNLHFQRQNR